MFKCLLTWLDFVWFVSEFLKMLVTWFDFVYWAGLMNFIAVESGGRILMVALLTNLLLFKLFRQA